MSQKVFNVVSVICIVSLVIACSVLGWKNRQSNNLIAETRARYVENATRLTECREAVGRISEVCGRGAETLRDVIEQLGEIRKEVAFLENNLYMPDNSCNSDDSDAVRNF